MLFTSSFFDFFAFFDVGFLLSASSASSRARLVERGFPLDAGAFVVDLDADGELVDSSSVRSPATSATAAPAAATVAAAAAIWRAERLGGMVSEYQAGSLLIRAGVWSFKYGARQ